MQLQTQQIVQKELRRNAEASAIAIGITRPQGKRGNKANADAAPSPKAKGKAKAQAQSRSESKGAGNRLKKLWCVPFLKGQCKHGDACVFPHLNEEAVNATKAALAANKKQQGEKKK